jgi:serine/threonine protein kinase
MADQAFAGSLKPGTTLDKYEIRGQLAVGGMAIIYKAYDPTLDRYVAIKQIAPHLSADEKFVARFRVEAQTLARLSSSQPNIVHVHELIQQDGQLFLVMEHVEGTTLRTLMDRGPVPLQTGLGVLLSTALGLRAMHAQNIVHRDLTPANIMMAKDGALKITDFGLIGHSGGKTSLPMGTTKYMAPEMFTGVPVDPRADLYSLGMIAYEMFAGPEKFAEAFRDVMRDEKAQQVRWMHWHSNPGLRVTPLKELQPGIPPLISKVVERLMDKDATKRFASADQFIKWLRKIFVMTVQGKSVTVADSESMEKELEAEAVAPPPRPRPGATGTAAQTAAATAATGPAKESPDKTAPLPKTKWTLNRTLLVAATVVVPLVCLCVGYVLYSYNKAEDTRKQATADQLAADADFQRKDFGKAAEEYRRIVQVYPTFTELAQYAKVHAVMAQAEDALAKRQWPAADTAITEAQERGAPPRWVNEFKTRFDAERYIFEKMDEAERKAQANDIEGAIKILTDLAAVHKDQADVLARLKALTEKVSKRQYADMMDKAKAALLRGKSEDLKQARDYAAQALIALETQEAKDLIAKIEAQQQVLARYERAEAEFAEEKYLDAAADYDIAYKAWPSAIFKEKYNKAMTLATLQTIKTLLEAKANGDAAKLYAEILAKYDPANAEAKKFLEDYKAQGERDALLAQGNKAMEDQDWTKAVTVWTKVLPMIPADDATLKELVQGKWTDASYNAAVAAANKALAEEKFDVALAQLAAAKALKASPEIDVQIATVEKKKKYRAFMILAKQELAAGLYAQARKDAAEAYKIDPTPEAAELKTEIEYQYNLNEGKKLEAQMLFSEALGRYKIAQQHRDTPEIQARIDVVQKKIAAKPKDAP